MLAGVRGNIATAPEAVRARRRWAWEEGALRGLDRDPEELANSQGPLSRTLGNSLVERFAWTRRFPDGMRYV